MVKPQVMTLYELNSLVRETIELEMPDEYWVEAEISELHEVGGHCYLNLIQKEEFSNTPIAKASAKCWKSSWQRIKKRFEEATHESPRAGMKMLMRVNAQFHENYGFAWIVSDIDPIYTLGDMAAKRQQILKQLEREGVLNANKELKLPLFTQYIAVISSATAAGYGDFCKQLTENEFHYSFRTELFTATLQGEGVEQSVISALQKIQNRADEFDCVVITRGGGATSDLSGFDTLNLARCVAYCSIPVFTAIGHERDESVLDIISNKRLKTPTAAAAYLIDRLRAIEDHLDELSQRITRAVQSDLEQKKWRLHHLAMRIPALFAVVESKQNAKLDTLFAKALNASKSIITQKRHHLEHLTQTIPSVIRQKFCNENHRLELLTNKIIALDPQLILNRGYSITTYKGMAVKDAMTLTEGCIIETRLKSGNIVSEIVNPSKSSKNS